VKATLAQPLLIGDDFKPDTATTSSYANNFAFEGKLRQNMRVLGFERGMVGEHVGTLIVVTILRGNTLCFAMEVEIGK